MLISIAGTNPKPVLGEAHLEVGKGVEVKTVTPLGNIDITQRFNLTIPNCHVCFNVIKESLE